MKKSIKNFIIITTITVSAFAFSPTFAMESNHKPSIIISQQVPTESEQIELITQRQIELKDLLVNLGNGLPTGVDINLDSRINSIINEIAQNEKYIKELQKSTKLKAKDN